MEGITYSARRYLEVKNADLLKCAKLPYWGEVIVFKDSTKIKSQKLHIGSHWCFDLFVVPDDMCWCLAWSANLSSDPADATAQLYSEYLAGIISSSDRPIFFKETETVDSAEQGARMSHLRPRVLSENRRLSSKKR